MVPHHAAPRGWSLMQGSKDRKMYHLTLGGSKRVALYDKITDNQLKNIAINVYELAETKNAAAKFF
jgi:hypothetical protein